MSLHPISPIISLKKKNPTQTPPLANTHGLARHCNLAKSPHMMSDLKTKWKLPQVSRMNHPQSHTDCKSVCPKDSGGDKNLTKRPCRSPIVLRVAAFNVRTLLSEEKFVEMENELRNIKWDIVGVSEVRRRGESLETLKSGHIFYHNGEENESLGGVGFFIHKNHSKDIVTVQAISTRVIYLILRINKRYSLKIIQVYAPTTTHTDEEVEVFYDDISRAMTEHQTHFTIISGDFNAKIGIKLNQQETSLGNFGSPGRNDRGETLLNFLLENNLYQMNSFFYKKLHRRWTWKSPDGRTKNEIDYFLTNQKHLFKDLTVLNKFATSSDHRMVRATIEIRTNQERYKMLKNKRTTSWTQPRKDEFENKISRALRNKSTINDIDKLNHLIVESIIEVQENLCPPNIKEQRLSQETKTKMEQRRELKSDPNANQDIIKELNKDISKAIKKDLRKYKNGKIIQTIEKNKSMKVMKRKFTNGKKEIFKLKNGSGRVTTNREELLRIVEEFYGALYKSESTLDEAEYERRRVLNQGSEDIPDISVDEVYNALQKMKNNKAPGEDGITTESLKIGGKVLIRHIQKLFNLCLHNQSIPGDWNNSLVILIHKKGDRTDLENYRPISLLSQLYKLYTRIITNRLEAKLDFYQPREQAGFRSGYGTNDHLQCLKILIEKTIEYNRPLVLIFVDFRKAFDTVELSEILAALQESRVDQRYCNIIKNIYLNATTTVNLHSVTNKIHIKRGVRQGDTLSPKLFITVLEYAFKKVDWEHKGIVIDGERLNHLRFADDIVLISDNLEEAKNLLEELQNATNKVGLHINFTKTKMMTNMVPSGPIQLGSEDVEVVHKYVYLGHEIRIGRDNQTPELSRRIALGWAAYGRMRDVFKGDIPISLKRKAFNQCIMPVLSYGAETLTLTKASMRKLQVAQRSMERSMLGLSLRDRVRNEEIRRRTRVNDVVEHVLRSKWRWAGHVARMRDGRWTKKVLEWRPRADTRSRGRPPTRWSDDLKRVVTNWIASAQNRIVWGRLEEAYVRQWTREAA